MDLHEFETGDMAKGIKSCNARLYWRSGSKRDCDQDSRVDIFVRINQSPNVLHASNTLRIDSWHGEMELGGFMVWCEKTIDVRSTEVRTSR